MGMMGFQRATALWVMLAQLTSAAIVGCDAELVTVEVDAARGLPQWRLVGLAAIAVRESHERVSAALANAGFDIPPRRITVSLSPGDLRKDGTAFDLPIALATLVAIGRLRADVVRGLVAIGELGLDGTVRPVRGVLAVARRVASADPSLRLLVPSANGDEGALVGRPRVHVATDLTSLVTALERDAVPLATSSSPMSVGGATISDCLSDVVGQPLAVRAIEIAAAGGHSVAFVGPPGAGKTMLARRLSGVLPPLDDAAALEVLTIQSIAGLLRQPLSRPTRPFRAPHHTASPAALVGGGSPPRPGEVTLAHHGVLFLDEFSLFSRAALDALREPIEDGAVQIARATGVVRFPSRTQVIIASNPCGCGLAGEPGASCRCSPGDRARHAGRLGGPLFDRVDLHVRLGRVPLGTLTSGARGPTSAEIAARVVAARARQVARNAAGIRAAPVNASLTARALEQPSVVSADARRAAARAADVLLLSARGFHRVLRVARTIADLDERAVVTADDVGEALRFRPALDGFDADAERARRLRSFAPIATGGSRDDG
jgi:magnesium chelatase family protein